MEFSDQDLKTVFNRALRTVLIAGLVGIPMTWFAWGWRSMLLFVVGGVIAATGILEWRQLMGAVLARLDQTGGPQSGEPQSAEPQSAEQRTARPIGPVVVWFFLRLVFAAALLYVSLKSLNGRAAALLIGLALALLSLFIEALRLFRGWSA
jgi:hypothetical protein